MLTAASSAARVTLEITVAVPDVEQGRGEAEDYLARAHDRPADIATNSHGSRALTPRPVRHHERSFFRNGPWRVRPAGPPRPELALRTRTSAGLITC
jgi:hypothetical protein